MFYIAHRVNTLDAIKVLSPKIAIEFDVRDSNGRLIVTHDPFKSGPFLEDFLLFCRDRFLIVNIKSSGIEPEVLRYLGEQQITEFFLLDCSPPMMKHLSDLGETRLAVRYSELEGIDTVLKWAGRAQWVWVDCFFSYILTQEIETLLHAKGFKICMVSPELQGRPNDIPILKKQIIENAIHVEAICTKSYFFGQWKLSKYS